MKLASTSFPVTPDSDIRFIKSHMLWNPGWKRLFKRGPIDGGIFPHFVDPINLIIKLSLVGKGNQEGDQFWMIFLPMSCSKGILEIGEDAKLSAAIYSVYLEKLF